MEKDNPNELVVAVFHDDDCPASDTEATETVNGVLVRSRIKPVTWENETPASTMPWLVVSTGCTESGSVSATIDFVGQDPTTGARFRFGIFPYGSFGNLGSDRSAANFNDFMKTAIEAAITDYLKANFDL